MVSFHVIIFPFLFYSAFPQPSTIMEEEDRNLQDQKCQMGDGKFYRGKVATTKSGYTCQKWSSQSPRSHSRYTEKNKKEYGLGEHNYCRDPDDSGGVWCYAMEGTRWDFCDVPTCGLEAYMGLKNDGSEEYRKRVQYLLPRLFDSNQITENQIGVAYAVTHPEKFDKYPWALRTGKDIKTVRVKQQTMSINGKVNKVVGRRNYELAKYRTTGLYAKPGKIVTISIPEKLTGKLRADIGHDFPIKFTLKKSTQKIGSPFGGVIVIVLEDIDATTKQGQFSITIGNAIQAPYFIFGENTNEEWNHSIKKNAPPFATLKIPGQLQIYIEIENIKKETDMEAILGRWKHTMDLLDYFIGIPINSKPGEEQLHFRPGVGGGFRGGSSVCNGGGHSTVGAYYYPDFPTGGFHTAYHEFGHGYCYRNSIPNMGGQMWADTVAQYMERIAGNKIYQGELGEKHKLEDHEYSPVEKEYWNFNLLYTMVSFSKFSKGKACGVADFKFGRASWCKGFCSSYTVTAYYNCWTELYQLPLWEFGWEILGKVINADGRETKEYASQTDRLADLYCKATKRNLIPLFNFFNIDVTKSISDECEKHDLPDKITKYIKIANCIKKKNLKDITECTKLPGFPEHKGICTFNGVCNKNVDNNDKSTTMVDEFDLWGGVMTDDLKSGVRYTGQIEGNCLARAGEMWKWCRNGIHQKITATFSPKSGSGVASSSYTYPPPDYLGGCQTGKGEDYKGTATRTELGYTCQYWNLSTPHYHSVGTDMKHNYCRNPDGEPRVWCYTTSKKEKWDFCDVPVCGTVGR